MEQEHAVGNSLVNYAALVESAKTKLLIIKTLNFINPAKKFLSKRGMELIWEGLNREFLQTSTTCKIKERIENIGKGSKATNTCILDNWVFE